MPNGAMFLKDSVADGDSRNALLQHLEENTFSQAGSRLPEQLGCLDDWMMIGCLECFYKSRFFHQPSHFIRFFLWLNIFLYNAFSLICGNDGRVVCSSITITVNLALCSHATRPP